MEDDTDVYEQEDEDRGELEEIVSKYRLRDILVKMSEKRLALIDPATASREIDLEHSVPPTQQGRYCPFAQACIVEGDNWPGSDRVAEVLKLSEEEGKYIGGWMEEWDLGDYSVEELAEELAMAWAMKRGYVEEE